MDESRIEWNTDVDEGVEWSKDKKGRNKAARTEYIKENVTQLKFCAECGKRVSTYAEICPYCGVRVMQETRYRKGSILLSWAGISVGFVALIFLSRVPILGPVLAGLAAGIIADGSAGKGFSTGFTAGMMWFLFLEVFTVLGGPLFVMPSDSFTRIIIELLESYPAVADFAVGFLFCVLCSIGGAVGGILRGK